RGRRSSRRRSSRASAAARSRRDERSADGPTGSRRPRGRRSRSRWSRWRCSSANACGRGAWRGLLQDLVHPLSHPPHWPNGRNRRAIRHVGRGGCGAASTARPGIGGRTIQAESYARGEQTLASHRTNEETRSTSGTMAPESNFESLFDRWAGRVRRRLAIRRLLTGAALGAVVALVPAGVAWKMRAGKIRPYAALTVLAGVAAGAVVARRKRWDDGAVALY